MKKKGLLILLFALCMTASFSGCRKKIAETETETQTVTESETEKETEKPTEKVTEKETEKETEKKVQKTTTKTTEKTTVKPSTVKPGTTTTTTETKMCPYCYNYIALTPNPDGTTVYSVHVAQEKAWADTYGYGTAQPSTQAATQAGTQAATDSTASSTGDDSAQCSYCYQWFSISDGSYAAHISQEQNSIVSGSVTIEYIQCPNCSNVYPSGSAYNTHVCVPVQ